MRAVTARRTVLVLVVVVVVGWSSWTAATADPWKFAVVCDSRGELSGGKGSTEGVRASVLGPIAAAIAAEGIDLVVFPGDEVAGIARPVNGSFKTQLTRWRAIMAPLYAAHIPVYAVRGNHDTGREDPTVGASVNLWRKLMADLPQGGPPGEEGLTYRVDHQNATFIGFDAYVHRSPKFNRSKYDGAVNYGLINEWVISQIRETPAPWVFVFGHETAFIENHTDCLANAPRERDALWDALGAKHGVYLCGHDHMYVRSHAPDANGNEIIELIVGSGGAGFYPRDEKREAMNETLDRHVRPALDFVNGKVEHGVNTNTDHRPPAFGYLVITVDGNQATGEWKAFANYDAVHWCAPATPKFETWDTFTLSDGR